MTMLLQVTGLSKRFGGVQAVDDLSFGIGPGEIVGLIGPNGAGKSTAFNLINGVVKPDRGKVAFDGEDITGLRPDRIAKRAAFRSEFTAVTDVELQPGHNERHRFVRDTLRDAGIESLDMSAFAAWVPKLKAQMQQVGE